MLKIRLKRAGGKNRPFYRVVVMDSRKARDSRALEEIGYYNPLEDPMVFNVNREKVAFWTERGAQITDSVKGLLKRENNTHPTRRIVESFDPEPPEEKAPPKPKKKKTVKATAKKTKDTAGATKTPAEAAKETADTPAKKATVETADAKIDEPPKQEADKAAGADDGKDAKDDKVAAPAEGDVQEATEKVAADAEAKAKD